MKSVILLILLSTTLLTQAQEYEVVGTVNDMDLVKTIDGKLGVRNANNQLIIKPSDYSVIVYREEFDLFFCGLTESIDLFDDKGNPVLENYAILAMEWSSDDGYIYVYTSEGMGIANGEFQIVVQPLYDNIKWEAESYNQCCINFIVTKNDKVGIVLKDNEALAVEFDQIESTKRKANNNFTVQMNGKIGLYTETPHDASFIELLPPIYYKITRFNDVILIEKNKMKGVVKLYADEKKSKVIIDPKYSKIDWDKRVQLEDDLYLVKVKDKIGSGYLILNTNPENDSIYLVVRNYEYLSSVDLWLYETYESKFGIFKPNYSNIQTLNSEYDEIKTIDEGIVVRVENNWGFYGIDLNLVLEVKYSSYEALITALTEIGII